MTITSITNNSVRGMRLETARLSAIADNVANLSTPGYQPTGADADPQAAITAIVDAEENFKLDAAVFETGADLWDVLKTINRTPR